MSGDVSVLDWDAPFVENMIISNEDGVRLPYYAKLNVKKTSWNPIKDVDSNTEYYEVYIHPMDVKKPVVDTGVLSTIERKRSMDEFNKIINTPIMVKVRTHCVFHEKTGRPIEGYVLAPHGHSSDWDKIPEHPYNKYYHKEVLRKEQESLIIHSMTLSFNRLKKLALSDSDDLRKKTLEEIGNAFGIVKQYGSGNNTGGENK